MQTKTLDEWISQMESDPASLVPILATPEGRNQLQMSSLASPLPNMLRLLQEKGHSMLEATGIVSPLLSQIALPQAVAMFPLRTQPELLWCWWLAKNNAVQEAQSGWRSVDPQRMALLGFQWAWTYEFSVVALKKDHCALTSLSDEFVHNMPAPAGRALWELLHTLVNEEASTEKCRKDWHALVNASNVDFSFFTDMPCWSMPKGFSNLFVDMARKANADTIGSFMQAHPQSIKLHLREDVLGEWTSPLGGLALLLGSGTLDRTALKNYPEVASVLGMFEAVGLDLAQPADLKTARAWIQNTYTSNAHSDTPVPTYELPDIG